MRSEEEIVSTAAQVLDVLERLISFLEKLDTEHNDFEEGEVDEFLDDIGRSRLLLRRLL